MKSMASAGGRDFFFAAFSWSVSGRPWDCVLQNVRRTGVALQIHTDEQRRSMFERSPDPRVGSVRGSFPNQCGNGDESESPSAKPADAFAKIDDFDRVTVPPTALSHRRFEISEGR